MDALPQFLTAAASSLTRQHTLKAAISCVGVGLHSGVRVRAVLHPAEPGAGVLFRRTDTGATVPARFDHVGDTRFATSLGDGPARVGTIEHLMAALSGLGIDNALIELDGPELPILDGSAAPWMFLIDCAGITEQEAPRRAIEIRRPVRVGGEHAWAELAPPGPFQGLELAVEIEFGAAAIGAQSLALRLTPAAFRRELARARTFTLAAEVENLRAAGLARGGSLENAVVVDGAAVLNPGGLRMADEFARHKLLDAVGDLALAGAPLRARFRGHRSGHALHHRLLEALFGDKANWTESTDPAPVPAAA
ncbi:MAG TPA: UDP-3-O-acyl-N-acetylglucosamine deacetylase [Acetobacteraceae bacterium]|nr:UDP-3-O-acyl-N-acetylglucosamine deacetylase [Acetobacteraceae bacterium]